MSRKHWPYAHKHLGNVIMPYNELHYYHTQDPMCCMKIVQCNECWPGPSYFMLVVGERIAPIQYELSMATL